MNSPRGLEQATFRTAGEWGEEKKDMEYVTGLLSRCPPHPDTFHISCLRPVFLSYHDPATPFSQLVSSPGLGACETELKFLSASSPCCMLLASDFAVLVSERHLPARNLAT